MMRTKRDETRRAMPQLSARLSSSWIFFRPATRATPHPPVHPSTSPLFRSHHLTAANMSCSAFDALFQPSSLDALITIHTDESTCKSCCLLCSIMGNYSSKFRCRHQKSSYLDRHPRLASPSRTFILSPPTPTLPRTFQSSRKLCFLWFWCYPLFLTPYLSLLVSQGCPPSLHPDSS